MYLLLLTPLIISPVCHFSQPSPFSSSGQHQAADGQHGFLVLQQHDGVRRQGLGQGLVTGVGHVPDEPLTAVGRRTAGAFLGHRNKVGEDPETGILYDVLMISDDIQYVLMISDDWIGLDEGKA